ncbi:MAG: hypothetical protein J7M26_01745 [Armatimonadetes bacterium]|nr:hypothetical protein [Armatimonadota bacterium]
MERYARGSGKERRRERAHRGPRSTGRWLLPSLLVLAAPLLLACPYSIRDSGFIVREPYPYRLLVAVDASVPDRPSLAKALASAVEPYEADANLTAQLVDLSDPAPDELTRRVAALELGPLPAVVLLTPRDRLVVLKGLGGPGLRGPRVAEMVRQVVFSPARDQISRHLISDWCVVLVCEGPDAAENRQVQDAVAQASQTVAGEQTEMGQKISTPPFVLTLPYGAQGEEVLLATLGLDQSDSSRARLAVLFGKARRLGPVIPATQAKAELLAGLFRLLGRNCTCTSDPRLLLGPAAPLLWGADLRQRVHDELGFDPDSPAAVNSLAGAWVILRDPQADWSKGPAEGIEEFARSLASQPTVDYQEFTLGPPEEGAGEGEEEPPRIDFRLSEPSAGQNSLSLLLMLVGGLVVVAVVGTAFIFLRQRSGR